MKRIFLLILFLTFCTPSHSWFGGGGPFGQSMTNPATRDLDMGTHSIDGDSTAGLVFDPDNDGTNEVTMSATGGMVLGGTNERLTFTTHGEYFFQNTDDILEFQGASGTDNTNIAIDLDGTGPRIYSPTDDNIIFDEKVGIGTTAPSSKLEIESSSFEILKIERTGAANVGVSFLMENSDNSQARIEFSGNETIDIENPANSVRMSMDAHGLTTMSRGLVPAKVTSDPCAGNGYAEGAIFYNDTGNFWCGCNGSNDIKLSDGAACF